MAEIRPFKGVRYNPRKIADLAAVVCPPYDIISLEQQDQLYEASEYNFVRIEYNRQTSQDDDRDNRYTRAANYLASWLEQGILMEEAEPALYVHMHHFNCQGKSYRRQDIITCVRLEEWDKQIIRPHENIIPRAKSDRMNMLYACRANTSQVLAMYQDTGNLVQSALAGPKSNPPVMDFRDPWGDRHEVWAVSQPEAVRQVREVMASQPLYIADGHHRYDSALTCKREMTAQTGTFTGQEGFNFVMMSLIDFSDPGMVVLPTHRLVKGIPGVSLSQLKSGLLDFFDIDDLPADTPDAWSGVDTFLSGLTRDMSAVRLAVYGLEPGRILILTLRDSSVTDAFMPPSRSDLYRKLDVSLVDHVILEKLLGYNKAQENLTLAYTHDREEAVNRVNDREYQLAFILNPISPGIIQGIADAGDRMPRKSTYFYPKTPAGLVLYRW
jgi:uncharacterized protein (DUF1015 family)